MLISSFEAENASSIIAAVPLRGGSNFRVISRGNNDWSPNLKKIHFRTPTVWRDFCGSKKNSVIRFDFFFYDRNDSATVFPDTPLSFSGKRQLFLKFSKIWKKMILKRFS